MVTSLEGYKMDVYDMSMTDVEAANATLTTLRDKVNGWARPNSKNAAKIVETLEDSGFDMSEVTDLLDEYANMERTDYSDAEEYRDAREDAWNAFVDALNDIEDLDVTDTAEYAEAQDALDTEVAEWNNEAVSTDESADTDDSVAPSVFVGDTTTIIVPDGAVLMRILKDGTVAVVTKYDRVNGKEVKRTVQDTFENTSDFTTRAMLVGPYTWQFTADNMTLRYHGAVSNLHDVDQSGAVQTKVYDVPNLPSAKRFDADERLQRSVRYETRMIGGIPVPTIVSHAPVVRSYQTVTKRIQTVVWNKSTGDVFREESLVQRQERNYWR
jgi:hypothetical protein